MANYEEIKFHGGEVDDFEYPQPGYYYKGDNLVDGLKTRFGSRIYSPWQRLATGNDRINHQTIFDSTLFIQSKSNLYYDDGSEFGAELQGPGLNDAFVGQDEDGYIDVHEWKNHLFAVTDSGTLPVKVYIDAATGNYALRTAGQPPLSTDPTITPVAGANTYLYAFVRTYEYEIGTTTFKDYSKPIYVEVTSATAPDASAIAITAIETLTNTSTTHYDVSSSNLKTEIYRTIASGTVFYYVDAVANGTTTYSDTTSDADLQTAGITLYTEGGAVEYEQPPASRFLTITSDGRGYFGYVIEDGEVKGFRVRQSIPGDIDSNPSSFYVDMVGDLRGLSSLGTLPLVFTKNSILRIEGYFDASGSGYMRPDYVSESVGLASNRSIVKTDNGLYFASYSDGFYFTNGYQTKKISALKDDTYEKVISSDERRSRIWGAYDAKRRRVYWAVQLEDSSTDNDAILMYDEEKGSWHTFKNGSHMQPTTLRFEDNGDMISTDSRGYLIKYSDDYKGDARVDIGKVPDEWGTAIIPWDYQSMFLNMGTNKLRKWGGNVTMVFDDISNANIEIFSCRDKNFIWKSHGSIETSNHMLYGTPGVTYGTPGYTYGSEGIIEGKRRYPKNQLRFTGTMVRIKPSYKQLYSSTNYVIASTDATTKIIKPKYLIYAGIYSARLYIDLNDHVTRGTGVHKVADSGNVCTIVPTESITYSELKAFAQEATDNYTSHDSDAKTGGPLTYHRANYAGWDVAESTVGDSLYHVMSSIYDVDLNMRRHVHNSSIHYGSDATYDMPLPGGILIMQDVVGYDITVNYSTYGSSTHRIVDSYYDNYELYWRVSDPDGELRDDLNVSWTMSGYPKDSHIDMISMGINYTMMEDSHTPGSGE